MYFNYNRTFLKPCTLETVWAGLLYTTLALVNSFEIKLIITLIKSKWAADVNYAVDVTNLKD